MNYGRLDSSSIVLAATQWTFGLPRNLHWPTVRANPPKITEPDDRYFIHCLQHWIVRFPHLYPNRYHTFKRNELDQETILVDNHGQVYVIYALAGLADDWGVRWFTIVPDASHTPLSPSQIDEVRTIDLPPQEEDGLPSLCRYHQQITAMIRETIQNTAENTKDAVPDPLTEKGIYEAVGPHPMNASKPEEPAPRERKLLSPKEVRNLQQAYINIQHSRSVEEQEDGHRILVSYLRASMPKQFHKRIGCLNRTMLARKLAKYYVVAFPKSTDKALPILTTEQEREADYQYSITKRAVHA
jgi:hypothetical protein